MIKLIPKQLAQEKLAVAVFLVGVACVTTTSGCSTISFFPTAPAQKAADSVIDDIWPSREVPKTPASTAVAPDAVAAIKPTGTPAK